MKFGKMMQNKLPELIDRQKFEFSTIQDGGGRRFEKPLKRDLSATVWSI